MEGATWAGMMREGGSDRRREKGQPGVVMGQRVVSGGGQLWGKGQL